MSLLRRKVDPRTQLDLYLHEMQALGKSAHTIRSYRAVLRRWIGSDQEPGTWLLEYAANPGVKASTVNHRRAVLRAYFAWLYERGHVESNPMDRTRIAKTSKRLQRVLSVEEVAKLIDGCAYLGKERFRDEHTQYLGHLPIEAYRARLAAMIALQVTGGLRVSEMCRVKLDDLDSGRRTLRVVGKGDKERELRFGLVARKKVAEWMAVREGLPGPYLFCTADGVPVQPRVYARQLAEASWWADLDPVNPHLLRHTFATHAIEAGVPVADLKEMLGHEQIATTMRYVHRERSRTAWREYDEAHPLAGDI